MQRNGQGNTDSERQVFFILKIFNFLSFVVGHIKKWFDYKAKVNFKIYDVTTQVTNNYNRYNAQYLKKQRQPDNEIWSCNIKYNKTNIFFSKITQKMGEEDQLETSFCFFKKALYEVKASDLQLSFNIFRHPSTWPTIKPNCIKLQTTDPEICSIFVFQKRVWEQYLQHILCKIFQENGFSYYILLTNQTSLHCCLYLLRHWSICVLQLFVNQVITHKF